MIKIGITGGIGSGKTTVCKIFELLGIPVYYADERAKWLMVNDENLIHKLKEAFGEKVYYKNGTLNRKYLANLIFNDQEKLNTINSIVHPAVYSDSKKWHEEQRNVPFTLKEAALFFENGSYIQMDKMITVTAPKSLRIKRVTDRDQTDKVSVEARINKQLPESEKVKLSDFVINNDGSQSLIHQVLNVYNLLKND